jgi:hypothetical protein
VKFLLELDERILEIKQRHLSSHGRPLRVVILSDHGNSDIKIRKAKGLRKALRKAGLQTVSHLERPGQVVAPTFGIVGYGALFMHRDDAETAGTAVVARPSVDLAAWLAGPRRMIVLSDSARGEVRWTPDPAGGWRIAYAPLDGDPLGYAPHVERMRQLGQIDRDGFVHEAHWVEATADATYPDAPRRLIHSLVGTYVENYATVVFSLEPGFGWGWTSAHVSSKLSGGHLEGTHGGLDAASSIGVFLTDDPALQPRGPVRADSALAPLAGLDDCMVVTGDDDHPAGQLTGM